MLAFGAEPHPSALLMRDLAVAMANERLPADDDGVNFQERVDAAIEDLRSAAGEHVLADTAATVAFFAAMTITVDATGHSGPELPRLIKRVAWLRSQFDAIAFPAALLVAGGLALAIALRFARRTH